MSVKKKDTDSKIKFFKIDDEGIAPAFPKEPDEGSQPALIQPEPPLIDFDSPISAEQPTGTHTHHEEVDIPNINATPANPQRAEQLHLLKPQVDDIAKMADESLTSDQTEILKKYISLKESEVRDLKDQHRQYESFLKKVSSQLETHTRRNRELLNEMETLKRREETIRNELRDIKDKYQSEIVLLKNDYEERMRSSGNYEAQADDLVRKREEWREKVREDLKRIKLKERELENKYELLKRDSQALLDSKDRHVLELKKKNDALELELESLEDRLRKGNSVLGAIDAKKRRLIETMKLAISLLEEIDQPDAGMDDSEPGRKAG